jgi:hypothetical protein
MGLPARLGSGFVSIYGLGQTGVADIVLPPFELINGQESGLTFGVINQIWDGFPQVAAQWSSVMFHTRDILASLVYQNVRYVLIQEDKIMLTEIPPP